MRETGQVVVSGMRDKNRLLFLFSPQWTGALREKKLDTPCGHSVDDLLCLQIAGQEYLTVACWECKDIKLTTMTKQVVMKKTDGPILAYSGEKFDKMCKGKNNRMFVSVGSSEGRVLELNCSRAPFELVQAMSLGLEANGLCYVPKNDSIVACGRRGDKSLIRAKSCKTRKTLWVFTKEVDSKQIDVRSMIYLRRQNRLLVADGQNKRILVLNPEDGTYEDCIDMSDPKIGRPDIGRIRGMILSHGQVVIRHGTTNNNKIAFVYVN